MDAALVRLVRDHRQVVPGREREELVDLGSRREVAVGVVRVRQDESSRARRHRSLDRLGIPARHRDEDAAGPLDQAAEEVARGRHDHLVAGLEQRAEGEAERVHGAVRDQDLALRVGGRRQARARSPRAAPRARATAAWRACSSSAASTATRTCSGSGAATVPFSGSTSVPASRRSSGDRRHLVGPHDGITGSSTCEG